MSAVNPYTPPRADVADVHHTSGETGPLKYWTSKGRIGRLRYLAWTFGASLLTAALMGLLGVVLVPTIGEVGMPIAMVLGYVPMLVFIVLALIQRTHDMGWSGWMCLLAFIPLVGLIWIFKAGTPGANEYGPPPPANGTGVKVLGFALPVVFVIAMIAAIALPAYVGYSQAARQAQPL